MAKKPMSEARRGRIRNIAEGAGVGATAGLMTSGDPMGAVIHGAIGAVVGAGVGVARNVSEYRTQKKHEALGRQFKNQG